MFSTVGSGTEEEGQRRKVSGEIGKGLRSERERESFAI
jgi:hypothetical protein